MSMSIVDVEETNRRERERCDAVGECLDLSHAMLYNRLINFNNDAVCTYAVRCTPTVERDFAAVVPFLCDDRRQQTLLGFGNVTQP
jgi:hypothetical protein